MDDTAEFFKFTTEEEKAKWLRHSCLWFPIIPTVFMGFYRAKSQPVNILATRILVDLDKFEIVPGQSIWEQAITGDVLFYRFENGKLFDYERKHLLNDWAYFFRKGARLPYNLLEQHVYRPRKHPTVTEDWMSVIYGDVQRLQTLQEVCIGGKRRLSASSQDTVLGAILAVMLRRLECDTWERNLTPLFDSWVE